MSAPLFREQAINAQNRFSVGRVRLQRIPYQFVVISCVIGLCTSVIVFVCFASYSKKTTVQGVLQSHAGVSTISSDIDGTVKSVFVTEGEKVQAGQPLVLIEPDISSSNRVNINEELTNTLENQKRLTIEETETLKSQKSEIERAYQLRHAALRLQFQQIQQELEINERQIRGQESIQKKLEQLRSKNYVSSLDFQNTEKELLSLKAARSRLQRQSINFEQLINDEKENLSLELSKISSQALALEKQLSNLESQSLQHQSNKGRLIISPATGYATNVLVHESQTVRKQTDLLTVTPVDDSLYAKVYIPTQSVGLVDDTQEVHLRVNAFPYQKYGTFKGRIASISRAPLKVSSSPAPNDVIFLAKVDLDDKGVSIDDRSYPLRSGMKFEADIILDNASVLELIFDPVLRFAKKI